MKHEARANKRTHDPQLAEAYALALEEERKAWHVVHRMPRCDPRYANLMSEWQAAADMIGKLAAKLATPET